MYSKKEQSLIDHILKASFELARMKDRNTYENFIKMNDKCRPHRLMNNLFKISSKDLDGRKIWTLAPKEDRTEQHVFFLHGGAYVVNMTPVHWFFIAAMIQALHCTVVVPDYPLLPGHGVKDVFDFVPKAYLDLTERVGASRITVMGDSAGGGLALALCQYLDKKLIDQPSYAVLMSPWLDINMDNPAIGEVDERDPVLNLQGLIDCGKAYAGNVDKRSYFVSPLYGSLEGLPDMSLFVGTYELMLPDARKFRQKASEAELSLDYHEIPGLMHDGMLYPTPEGTICRKTVFKTLKNRWTV
jgi:acetyl esterase/lipase